MFFACRRHNNGFVLIFALWALSLLTVLAASVAVGVRQKMIVIEKLDERSRSRYAMQMASALSCAHIRQQLTLSNFAYTSILKSALHNNPTVFSRILLGKDSAQVGYQQGMNDGRVDHFGVIDEERKINVNKTDALTLQRLLESVLSLKPEQAGRLSRSILDWRQWGEGEAAGFFSDDYYSNLQFSYRKKSGDYEVLDELLLIKGFTKDIYEQLLPYLTIYGDGKVNINTAPAPVLSALGLDDILIAKILSIRRGKDNIEATLDDYVFSKTFDIAIEVNSFIKLDPQEIRAIDQLNLQGVLTCNSYYFTMDLYAQLVHRESPRMARMVYAARENKVLYWKEK